MKRISRILSASPFLDIDLVSAPVLDDKFPINPEAFNISYTEEMYIAVEPDLCRP